MPATMAKKKGGQSESEGDRHRHAIMAFRPGDALREAVTTLAKSERRSVAQVVQILVEEALAARGLWSGEEGE